MTPIAGSVALVTGASYGLGAATARALAARGARLALVARSREALEALAAELTAGGTQAVAIPADLAQPDAPAEVVAAVERELGGIDILINNAGVEHTAAYHELPTADIDLLIDVNVRAPMVLTRLVLPGMVERRRGHIVHMASLAGIASPAFHEGYSASKAALIAFSHSLRASYRGTGVSSSVIVPGFVSEAGMHERMKQEVGVKTPALVGAVRADAVVRAVLGAIEHDRDQVLVTPLTTTVMTKLFSPYPAVGAFIQRALGVTDMYRRVAARHSAGSRVKPT
ncbi:MAG TPA: SDR family NAD(P)-dependent oxidoreductase [Longimicrobiales bacterium]|nr:SDR family NAD(P)-dependent oxidoreductase [Longimicrobiales bacterium]